MQKRKKCVILKLNTRDSKLIQTQYFFLENRCMIQGISPPITRSEEDFDPGAKYHVAGSVPYVRFVLIYCFYFQISGITVYTVINLIK